MTIVLNENVGLSTELSSLVAGCIQIAFWFGTLPPIFMLDKFGRRPLLLGGSISLTICMVLFTVGIALNTPASANLALAMLFLYEISFGMSWDAIPWLYAPEITPLDIRHVGSAVAVFSEWFWTFVRPTENLLSYVLTILEGYRYHDACCHQEHWMENLHPFLRNACSKHTIHLLLSSRGRFTHASVTNSC